MATQANQVLYGTAPPTDTNFYQYADIVINNAPAAGTPYGWVCVTVGGGNPGTWLPIVQSAVSTLTSTATTGTLANGQNLILLNAASGPTLSLPDVRADAVGYRLTIKNIANNSATLTPIAANNYADAAAITLTQFQVVNLVGNGGTTWFKAS